MCGPVLVIPHDSSRYHIKGKVSKASRGGGLIKSCTSPFENTYPPLKMVILVWTPPKSGSKAIDVEREKDKRILHGLGVAQDMNSDLEIFELAGDHNYG